MDDWVRDTTAGWLRIMGAGSADDGGGTPLDEAVRAVSAIADAPTKTGGGSGWRKRKTVTEDPSAVTALSRQLIAGVLVSDLAITRLCALQGQSRDQVLAQLSDDVPGALRDQQLGVLRAELSGSHTALRDEARASYSGLGSRIEQLLRLAEQQAVELIEAAQAEADKITASAAAPPPAAPPPAPESDQGDES